MNNIWEIYTVGDVGFSHSVILGLSHIFYGLGHNALLSVYMVGALFGFIWMFVESMMNAKPINFGRFFVAFIIYSVLFVPQCEVYMIDSQTNRSVHQGQVPLGVGAGWSIVSRIGHGISKTFEDFFIEPSATSGNCAINKMTCSGYIDPLLTIIGIQKNMTSPLSYELINYRICDDNPPAEIKYGDIHTPTSCNLQKTLTNYMDSCYTPSLITNQKDYRNAQNWASFKVNSNNTTLVYLYKDVPNGKAIYCKEAWEAIDSALVKPEVKEVMMNLAVKPDWIRAANIDESIARSNNSNKLKDSLSFLAGLGASTDAYTYLTNVVIRPSIIAGIQAGLDSRGEILAMATLKNAMVQRDLQNASEMSMWLSVSRSLATFFEGFVIAVVPFIPMIMFIGNSIGIIIKYLQVLLWVQLWSPVMTICNLYITKATAQAVQDTLQGANIGTFNAIESIEEVVQHWIGVGGMLAGLTPVLALFIISGSIYTFNSLVSRISGADHFNEKGFAPDLMQQTPLISANTGYEVNGGIGVTRQGTGHLYKNYDLQSMYNTALQTADTRAQSASSKLAEAFTQLWGESAQKNGAIDFGRSVSDQMQHGNNKQLQERLGIANDVIDSYGRAHGWGNNEIDQVKNSLSWALSAGLKIPVIKDILSFAGTSSHDESQIDSASKEIMANFNQQVSEKGGSALDISQNSGTQKTIGDMMSTAVKGTYQKGKDRRKQDSLLRAIERSTSASISRADVSSKANSNSSKMSMNSNQIAHLLNSDKIAQFLATHPALKDDLYKKAQIDGRGYSSKEFDTRFVEALLDPNNTSSDIQEARSLFKNDNSFISDYLNAQDACIQNQNSTPNMRSYDDLNSSSTPWSLDHSNLSPADIEEQSKELIDNVNKDIQGGNNINNEKLDNYGNQIDLKIAEAQAAQDKLNKEIVEKENYYRDVFNDSGANIPNNDSNYGEWDFGTLQAPSGQHYGFDENYAWYQTRQKFGIPTEISSRTKFKEDFKKWQSQYGVKIGQYDSLGKTIIELNNQKAQLMELKNSNQSHTINYLK